jgi:DNA-binding transcriptional regulator YiaG
MTPYALLTRHPGETLPWLRRQLRLNRRAFAAWLGVPATTVTGWEQGTSPIPPVFMLRLMPLVTRYLATAAGQALLRSLGQGEE